MKRLAVTLLFMIFIAACNSEEVAERDSYPTEPVSIIVPYSEGGSSDTMAKLSAEALSDHWGIEVTVDNRGGENAISGMQDIADAAPDGYTYGMFGSPDEHVLMELEDPSFIQKDFDHLMGFDQVPHALMSSPAFPGASLTAWRNEAIEQPGRVTVGYSGPIGELLILLLEEQLEVDVTPVRYDGGGDLVEALRRGEIDSASTSLSIEDYVIEAGGSLLGYGGEDRDDGLSFNAQSYDIYLAVMRTMVAPVGIPDDNREEMVTALEDVFQTEEWQDMTKEADVEFKASNEKEADIFLDKIHDIVDRRIEEIQE